MSATPNPIADSFALDALMISGERHRFIAENALDVLWTMAPTGEITYLSPAVEKLRGFTVEEAMAQQLHEILTPESANQTANYFSYVLTEVAAGRHPRPFRGEQEYLCKDGSTIWCDVMAYPVLAPEGTLKEVLGVSRDLTTHKRYEAELVSAREATEDANRALRVANAELAELLERREARLRRVARRSDYLARVEHVLRTDLSLVMGWAEMLSESYDEMTPAAHREALDAILRNANTLLGHLESLMTEATQTTGIEFMEPQPVKLAEVGRAVASDYSGVQRHVLLTADFPEEYLVLGSTTGLETVFRHLVENAIRHATSRVEILARDAASDWVEVSVRDDGPGLPPNVELFEAFTSYGPRSGHGLGLHVVRTLVEAMGGTVSAEDRLDGLGAEFKVTLRRTPDDK